ncbi:MAG TPA: tRNA (adenosine(37)-N6)-dimethylallyltransferase MiaA [Candidatus Binatia bacterium]|jgi:tRNA dimethylallyltransferase|nr:tRNA (adenosine(37)-N6)-dimethylallyltransferase MiaA [Candidatus Binatia bacterium]
MSRPRIVCLVGPTASGKTGLALELAVAVGAEVVSADSRQVYRGMDVGTAKPSAAERARVPHHGIDVVAPDEAFDAGAFRQVAASAIADIHARGRHVLVVGGTGLYLRALLQGLCPAPPRAPHVRTALQALATRVGAAELHRLLAGIDPTAAARIHRNDRGRLIRALEVPLVSGRTLSSWQASHGFAERPYEALVIGLALPVPELDARIAARAATMAASGFLDEVRALRDGGLVADAPGWNAVGYRELLACVEGRSSLDEALAATVLATRRFAKRQRTWFRAQPDVVWRHPDTDRDAVLTDVRAFLAGGAEIHIANPGNPG